LKEPSLYWQALHDFFWWEKSKQNSINQVLDKLCLGRFFPFPHRFYISFGMQQKSIKNQDGAHFVGQQYIVITWDIIWKSNCQVKFNFGHQASWDQTWRCLKWVGIIFNSNALIQHTVKLWFLKQVFLHWKWQLCEAIAVNWLTKD